MININAKWYWTDTVWCIADVYNIFKISNISFLKHIRTKCDLWIWVVQGRSFSLEEIYLSFAHRHPSPITALHSTVHTDQVRIWPRVPIHHEVASLAMQ